MEVRPNRHAAIENRRPGHGSSTFDGISCIMWGKGRGTYIKAGVGTKLFAVGDGRLHACDSAIPSIGSPFAWTSGRLSQKGKQLTSTSRAAICRHLNVP
jgi:hypothetical protein